MESLAVLAAGVAIIWVVFWVIRFDKAASIKEHRGPFRMRADTETAARPARPEIGSELGLDRPKRDGSS